MPISADPNRTAPVSLQSDQDKPLETRPVVLSRFLTRRQIARHRDLMNKAIELKSGDAAWACVYDAWRIGIVDWRNLVTDDGSPAPAFDRGENLPTLLHSIFTDNEIQEIAWNYPEQVRVAEEDLKNSGSPAPTAQAPSAKAATEPAATNRETEKQPTKKDA